MKLLLTLSLRSPDVTGLHEQLSTSGSRSLYQWSSDSFQIGIPFR